MDKIKKMMEELGISSELSEGFLKLYSETLEEEKKALHEEYDAKLAKAKEISVKLVKEEHTRIATGVRKFLENKEKSMEATKSKQMAIEESKSANKLEQVKALLEGVELSNVGENDRSLQAAKRTISLLENKVELLGKNVHKAVKARDAANEIATGAIRKNAILEQKLKGTDSKSKTIKEEKETVESKGKEETTKKTLTEAKQERKPAKPERKTVSKKDFTPQDIAGMMD